MVENGKMDLMNNCSYNRYKQSIAENISKIFSTEDQLTAIQWAEQIRRMDGGKKYRFDFAPYQR